MSEKKRFFNRYTALVFVSMLIFSALLIRLIFMQIFDTQYYMDQSNTDTVKDIYEPGPRGDIVDRNGIVLATDKQSYVLTFMSTEESSTNFFYTMEQVFKILDDKKEIQNDSFALKINPIRFDFNVTDAKTSQLMELRFKKDRGLDDYEIHEKAKADKSYNNKSYSDLSLADQAQIDAELLKIPPEQTFNLLWDQYTKSYLDKKNKAISDDEKNRISKMSLEDKRRYMMVKDALWMQNFSGDRQIVIAQNISRDTAFMFEEKLNELPGIDIAQQPVRTYPFGELASAVIGNVSRISSTSQEKYIDQGYDVNTDLVGVSGIEGAFESRLKGNKGDKLVEVNKAGRIVKEKARKEPYPGQKIQLTISSELQSVAETALMKALKDRQDNPNARDENTGNATRGAVVVLDVNTGEVLAMVSKPGFDPNLFAATGGLTTELSKKYFAPDLEAFGKEFINKMNLTRLNPDMTEQQLLDKLFPIDTTIKSEIPVRKDDKDLYPKPFFNYAISALVPPGSTFKPVTAIAGLETGVIDQYTTVDDEQYFDDGNGFKTTFPTDAANGMVNLAKALEVSSNPYFMTVGKMLRDANLMGDKDKRDDILAQYAWKLGLGVKPNSGEIASTGIELNSAEAFGQVYNTYTIKNVFANNYYGVVMQVIKGGKGHKNNIFPSIDLYANNNDSDEVKSLKSDIIGNIKNLIKTGTKIDSTFTDQLTKLVSIDNSYHGTTFKKTDYATIIQEINYIAVDDANFQATKIGTNIYNASIGQGINQFTPLQLADYVSTLVNGGNRYKVHLVNKISDADNSVVQEIKPEVLSKTGFNQNNIDVIKEGMKGVTGENGTAGVAFQGFDQYLVTGGKTGSATYQKDQDSVGRSSYSLFVGFAPYDKPQIAVCAVMFDGGYGSYAAPIVKSIYEDYFKDDLKKKGYIPTDDFMQQIYNK